jgi:hypothetical protein
MKETGVDSRDDGFFLMQNHQMAKSASPTKTAPPTPAPMAMLRVLSPPPSSFSSGSAVLLPLELGLADVVNVEGLSEDVDAVELAVGVASREMTVCLTPTGILMTFSPVTQLASGSAEHTKLLLPHAVRSPWSAFGGRSRF